MRSASNADPHGKLVDALVSLEHALTNIYYHSGGKDLPAWNIVAALDGMVIGHCG
jgi:hypothetical protein